MKRQDNLFVLKALVPAAFLLATAACGIESTPDESGKVDSQKAGQPPVADQVKPDEAQPEPSKVSAIHDRSHCRSIRQLLHVQQFTLNKPRAYHWMKDHPPITKGTLVVVDVEPVCAQPRQIANPILYVGAKAAEITNMGYPSGRVIAFVPGYVDLSQVPIYYGAAGLPERVDQQRGAEELAAARNEGIRPVSAQVVQARTEGALNLADTVALQRVVADLIDRYVPSEAELAKSMRVPVVK